MGDVVGDVADVGPEADHRRLMADVLDALQRRGDGGAVADVAGHELRGGVEVVGPLGVRRRMQRVEDPHLVAAGDERVGDVRPDEAGAAGDEHTGHGAAPGVTTASSP